MGVIARIEPVRQFSWRPVVVAAILIVALSASIALYAASQRSVSLPPPFGPAPTATSWSPPTATSSPSTSRRRRHARSSRTTRSTSPRSSPPTAARSSSNAPRARTPACGSRMPTGPTRTACSTRPGYEITWSSWSQSGDRLVIVGQGSDSKTVIALVDPDGGEPTLLRPDGRFMAAVHAVRARLPGPGGRPPGCVRPRVPPVLAHGPRRPRQPSTASGVAVSAQPARPVARRVGARLRDLGGRAGDRHEPARAGPRHERGPPDHATGQRDVSAGRPRSSCRTARRSSPTGGPSTASTSWPWCRPTAALAGASVRSAPPMPAARSGSSRRTARPILATYYDNGTSDRKVWQIDVASGVGTELSMPEPDYLSWQRAGE